MTNRSYHMPRLMKMERMNSQVGLRRSFCDQSDMGSAMLQRSMIHAAQYHWSNTRFQKNSCSARMPLYQATRNSMRYAHPTTIDVNSTTFAVASRWLSVM